MMIHNIIFHNVSRMPDKNLHNLEINLMSCVIKYFIFLKFKNTFHTTIFLTEMKKKCFHIMDLVILCISYYKQQHWKKKTQDVCLTFLLKTFLNKIFFISLKCYLILSF